MLTVVIEETVLRETELEFVIFVITLGVRLRAFVDDERMLYRLEFTVSWLADGAADCLPLSLGLLSNGLGPLLGD